MITPIKTRQVTEKVKIKNLFSSIGIKDVENELYFPKYAIKVNTPYGFKNIECLFRTEKQNCITSYFSNGSVLRTSPHHQFKVNGNWCKVKDIDIKNNVVESRKGITSIKKICTRKKKEILYDISVKDVHCYYSNNILSHNSWALVSLGLHALTLGKTVAHFTLELNEGYTAKRYDSRLTGIAAQNLKYHIDEIVRKVNSTVKGQLVVKYYPTKTATVTTIKSHLNKLISFSIKPDLIIVDYGDLLKGESIHNQKAGSYFEIGSIYEDLRGLAGEYQIPVWTASQAQRGASNDEIITGDQVAESYKKIMTGDIVISVARKIEDKLANTARWFVIKNRYGPDGLTFPSKMDASIGKIDIYAPTSVAGTETRKEMRNSNELVRKELANRYVDFE